jgi:hypothetical protein
MEEAACAGEPRGPLHPIEDHELKRLACARADVSGALQTCDLFLTAVKSDSDPLYMALFSAIVVSYARPFSGNRPMGSLSPEWQQFKDPRLQQTHDQLLVLRDKVVAHTDSPTVSVIPRGANIDGVHSGRLGILIKNVVFDPPWFQNVHDTCWDLRARLNEAAEARLEALYGHLPEMPDVRWDLL